MLCQALDSWGIFWVWSPGLIIPPILHLHFHQQSRQHHPFKKYIWSWHFLCSETPCSLPNSSFLSELWLGWSSTEMNFYRAQSQSLSYLQCRAHISPSSVLPFLTVANFMPPLMFSTLWQPSLNVLYSLTTFPTPTDPPTQAKPMNSSMCFHRS